MVIHRKTTPGKLFATGHSRLTSVLIKFSRIMCCFRDGSTDTMLQRETVQFSCISLNANMNK
jgi:hypothetical protein